MIRLLLLLFLLTVGCAEPTQCWPNGPGSNGFNCDDGTVFILSDDSDTGWLITGTGCVLVVDGLIVGVVECPETVGLR